VNEEQFENGAQAGNYLGLTLRVYSASTYKKSTDGEGFFKT
jgi:hypothetical protein